MSTLTDPQTEIAQLKNDLKEARLAKDKSDIDHRKELEAERTHVNNLKDEITEKNKLIAKLEVGVKVRGGSCVVECDGLGFGFAKRGECRRDGTADLVSCARAWWGNRIVRFLIPCILGSLWFFLALSLSLSLSHTHTPTHRNKSRILRRRWRPPVVWRCKSLC